MSLNSQTVLSYLEQELRKVVVNMRFFCLSFGIRLLQSPSDLMAPD